MMSKDDDIDNSHPIFPLPSALHFPHYPHSQRLPWQHTDAQNCWSSASFRKLDLSTLGHHLYPRWKSATFDPLDSKVRMAGMVECPFQSATEGLEMRLEKPGQDEREVRGVLARTEVRLVVAMVKASGEKVSPKKG